MGSLASVDVIDVNLAYLIAYAGSVAHMYISPVEPDKRRLAVNSAKEWVWRSYQSSKVSNPGDGSIPSPSKAHQALSLLDPARRVEE
jgi:hypothetical protein